MTDPDSASPRWAVDVATRETTDFFSRELGLRLGAGPFSLLEVGCGRGEVAAKLAAEGHEVLAIDTDESAVEAARSLGVEARIEDWLAFSHRESFAAILFSRSIHHIEPLTPAVEKIPESLDAGGCVLVEDFAFSECSAGTAEWTRSIADVLTTVGFRVEKDDFLDHLLSNDDAIDGWHSFHGGHEHPIHTSATVWAALESVFDSVEVIAAPYLYRYFIPGASEIENGADVVDAILRQERRLISSGALSEIGRRYIARFE